MRDEWMAAHALPSLSMHCDLHMHSTVSDGTLSVQALVHAVHDAGIAVFALTDHDTVAGLDEARQVAQTLGLRLVNGVEISTGVDGIELHILGYGFDPSHPTLLAGLDEQRAIRHAQIPKLVAQLNRLGLALDVEEVYALAGSGIPGRPHVASALVARGYVQCMDEAFTRYLRDGAPGHVPKPLPSPARAIAWIHAAGGKAVWAHPLSSPIQRPGGLDRLARELGQWGLDGIEVVHPAHDPVARKRLRRVAGARGWIVTGGSDFHGARSPGISIGVGRGRDRVPADVVDVLLD